MVPWILSETVIIALLEYMDRPTSLAFICAAKFLQPYINTLDHIKKISISSDGIFTFTYSGKLSLLEGKLTESNILNREVLETVKREKLIIRKIRCGKKHIAAITSTGELFLWGDNSHGQCNIPLEYLGDNTVKFSGVSCNYYSTAAITTTGKIVIFGYRRALQTIIPDIKNDVFSKISLGYDHIAAITSSGRLIAWGRDCYGQRNKPSSHIDTTFRKVSCGMYVTIAITNSGEAIIFTYLYGHEYANPGVTENNFRKISCYKHIAGITLTGKLIVWNICEQHYCEKQNFMKSMVSFSKIKCGKNINVLLTSFGEVVVWCRHFSPVLDA